jgi:hypothetical protein
MDEHVSPSSSTPSWFSAAAAEAIRLQKRHEEARRWREAGFPDAEQLQGQWPHGYAANSSAKPGFAAGGEVHLRYTLSCSETVTAYVNMTLAVRR